MRNSERYALFSPNQIGSSRKSANIERRTKTLSRAHVIVLLDWIHQHTIKIFRPTVYNTPNYGIKDQGFNNIFRSFLILSL